jgi:hypothetical protein
MNKKFQFFFFIYHFGAGWDGAVQQLFPGTEDIGYGLAFQVHKTTVSVI